MKNTYTQNGFYGLLNFIMNFLQSNDGNILIFVRNVMFHF